MKKIKCSTCRKLFEPPAKKPSQKYCSRECWRISRFRQVTRTCETCGKTFNVYQARASARFCSFKCRRTGIIKTCAWCGDTFYIKPSDASIRFTCSRRCALLLRAQEKRAPWQGKSRSETDKQKVSDGLRRYYNGQPEKHWNYQGGLSKLHGRGSGWNKRKDEARERDKYTCQICGKTETMLGRRLAVHHIIPYHKFPSAQEANQLNNLISTCQSCHMKLEHETASIPHNKMPKFRS